MSSYAQSIFIYVWNILNFLKICESWVWAQIWRSKLLLWSSTTLHSRSLPLNKPNYFSMTELIYHFFHHKGIFKTDSFPLNFNFVDNSLKIKTSNFEIFMKSSFQLFRRKLFYSYLSRTLFCPFYLCFKLLILYIL